VSNENTQVTDKGALLHALRIEPDQREQSTFGGRGLRIAIVVLLLCLLVAGALLYFLLRGRPIAVRSAMALAPAAGQAQAASVLQATGYVTARREATVSAQITGTLKQVLIEEGEQVKQGQVLARLEDTAQRATLAQTEAQLATAKAERAQYQAQLEQARRDLRRNEDMLRSDAVSRQLAEQSQTQVDTLDAQVAAQKTQIELAQAQLDGARVQLDYTVIRAPFSGVIIAKAAQVGEIISPVSAGGGFTRTGIGTIVDMDSLEIEVDVNEAYLHRVQAQQKAEATLDAYPDWKIPAHVIAIIPTADRSKATVKVRIGLDQKDPRILPDMGVRVSFLEDVKASASGGVPHGVFVPHTAVVERDGHQVLFVIDQGHARQRPIQSGAISGDLQLVEGVADGAQVVRDPTEELHDGSAVVVKE
jgi:RND family efflux transporter MFP subunit